MDTQVTMFVAFAVAIATSLLLTPFVVRAAAARGLFENPRGGERLPRRQVSRLGGVVIFAATTIAVVFAIALGALTADPVRLRFLVGLFLGGSIVFGLGLYDDIRGTRARTKLIVQCVAALIVYSFGTRVEMVTLGAAMGVHIGMSSLPLTILWIVGVTNAFNLIDGLDGLATGIALVVLCAVMIAAGILGNADVAFVSLVLVGALVGFLRYNISPASIFLGDSGSLFIGFMLAVLSIHGSLKSTTAVLVTIPIFALALPLLDAVAAFMRRWLRGSPVFGPDARHIHHRMLAAGLTPRRAAAMLCVVTAAFAAYGLSIAFAPPPMLFGVAVGGGGLALAIILFGMRKLGYVEFGEATLAVSRNIGAVRKVIRDQIHAREAALLIRAAVSLDELNAVLADCGWRFGFYRIEVNTESQLNATSRRAAASADMPRLWKMDYPVTRDDSTVGEPYMLRIWCNADARRHSYGAERVARMLAPSLEQCVSCLNAGAKQQRSFVMDQESRDIAFSDSVTADHPTVSL